MAGLQVEIILGRVYAELLRIGEGSMVSERLRHLAVHEK
jgi:hypothetical protein